jgi:hypothetical protein
MALEYFGISVFSSYLPHSLTSVTPRVSKLLEDALQFSRKGNGKESN